MYIQHTFYMAVSKINAELFITNQKSIVSHLLLWTLQIPKCISKNILGICFLSKTRELTP